MPLSNFLHFNFKRYWLHLKLWRQQKKILNHELELLEKNCRHAQNWLKKIFIPHQEKLITANKLPSYYLIGSAGAGKTALLTHSGLSFTHTAQLVPQQISGTLEPTRHCNWWVAQQALIIDVPGRYLEHDDSAGQAPYWQDLLSSVDLAIAGVIIAINTDACITQNRLAWQQHQDTLKQYLQTLARQIKQPLKISLCITKLDLLAGFTDYFADLGIEEQAQAFGINFSNIATHNQAQLLDIFNAEFAKLLQRLHERVLWRLSHERNANKRSLIQNFPLQLESIKTALTDLLQTITEVIHYYPHLQLQGYYFCSSLQTGQPYDNLVDNLRQQFNFSTTTQQPTTLKNQSYFVTQFWQNLLTAIPNIEKPTSRWRHWITPAIWLGASLLVLSATLWGVRNYRICMNAIAEATQAISSYQTLLTRNSIKTTNLIALLPRLNTLQHSVQALERAQLPWLSRWFMPDTQSSLQLAKEVYQRALQQQFLPSIVANLQQQLASDTGSNSALLYGNLKAYLMLGTPGQLQASYLEAWLKPQWNPDYATALQQHLSNALQFKPLSITLDSATINQARTLLWNTADATNLGYTVLKNQTLDKRFEPWDSLPTGHLKIILQQSHLASLPTSYNRNYFASAYTPDLIQATNAVMQGNWVLGPRPTGASLDFNDIRNSINQTYFTDYARYWQTTLNNLAKLNISSKNTLMPLLDEWTNNNTPLLAIAKIINYHSQVLLTANLSKQQLQAFIELQNFATPEHAGQYSNLIRTLHTLQSYLSSLQHDDKAAFNAAQQRLRSQSDPISQLYQQINTAPEPIRSWLQSIADQSWQQILDQTLAHLNHVWQSTVVTSYKASIAGRYPLNKNASDDINPTEFIRFFGPNGLLENYVNTYLKPFIDTQGTRWQIINLNNRGLALNSATLAQLERAAIIRTMYFHDSEQLATEFSLNVDELDTDITKAIIQINQQTYTAVSNKNKQIFIWQGDDKNPNARLELTDKTGQTAIAIMSGPWAWFKLLDKAEIQQLSTLQHYQIMFHINGITMSYHLTAKYLLNPFIPGVLQDFRCPEILG